MIGQTVSHYKILEKLGEGGMGVVYKAQDTKLDRLVALKFLPPQASATQETKERFMQEAKAAAALNHNNICTIHGVEEHDGNMFIVMEFIEGGTLRQKLPYAKINDALNVGVQIGEALQEAHTNGIVHRDIKADNVMLTSKGQAKVMDFGLAKLKGSLKLTRTSSTVGTLAYMAPEQIQGGEVDSRSDIFSFGVLLFEMLTGKTPFRGEHEAAMVYSIVNEEPEPLRRFREDAQDNLQHIILRCLEKDPEDRYQHVDEIVRELRRIQKQSSRSFKTKKAGEAEAPTAKAVEAALPQPSRQRIKPLWLSLGAFVVLALIGTIVLLVLKKEPAETTNAEVKITKFTSLPGLEDEPTWSPDGKFVAYTADDHGNFDILVQPVAGGRVIRVADSDADDAQPAWSPDGSKLAFVSARDRGGRFPPLLGQGLLETYLKGKNGDIFLVPALGGRPVKLVSNGLDPAWSPDGKTIVYRSIQGGQWDLWTVAAEGGTPKQLTNDIDMDYQPSWSPDGNWILYGSGVNANGYEVCVIAASGGRPMNLRNDKAMVVKPTWSPDGKYILFSSNRKGSMNIWKMPFKPNEKEFATPMRITVGEGDDINISAASTGSTIAFATVKTSPDIWEFTVKSGKLRQVSFETGLENHSVLSPNGKTLLVGSNRGGTLQFWTMDLNGNFLSQLTADAGTTEYGYWSPDGKEIAYPRNEHGKTQVVVRSLGDISPRKVIDNSNLPFWSPDGKKLVFLRTDTLKKRSDVWIHVLDTGEEKQLTSLEWNSTFPSWSPDGNWIAFNVEKKNSREIWMIPSFGGTPRQVLAGEAEYSHPMWSPRDKDVILCLKDHKNICLVSVRTGAVKQITNLTESSINLIDLPSWSWDGEKVFFSLFRKSGDIFLLEHF